MIINCIQIENFRQFVGNHQISFSTDPNKKATIIIAESGVGKTTLIQCFQWILYGECKYKSALNTQTKQNLSSGESTTTKCSINILHNDNEYTITRSQTFRKQNTKVVPDEQYLNIDIKDTTGITTQKRGKEASKIIKDIIHKDLFPYFFLEGESLTKVGEQMAKGKVGSNNEFVKAIKGLLGFNYLYEAQKHLKSVSSDYHNEIEKNTNDAKLNTLLKDIKDCKESIEKHTNRIDVINGELPYFTQQREELNAKISQYSELDGKQKQRKKIELELQALWNKIIEQRKILMKKFSSNGIYVVMNALLPLTEETLLNSDCLDKGIPGINVEAVQFMLNNHKCICGHELVEGTKEWETLKKWIDFLPPNNIGFEIERFNSDIRKVKKQYLMFSEDFEKFRKDYISYVKQYDSLIEEKEKLDEEIGSFNQDVSVLKAQEREYETKIIDYAAEKKNKQETIEQLNQKIEMLEKQRSQYKIIDEKLRKLNLYYTEAEYLRLKIERFCLRKEKEKRKALESAINEIFKDFYEEKIEFKLDDNYGVQIKTFDSELSDDFTSGGQDVAVALAFIGAIIKLIREKDNDSDNIIEDNTSEEYPLVMDAPTSNFGMKQMKSFSEIMPKITDQIIVFINDKDGPILRNQMFDQIGKEWSLNKEDTYHSFIKEVQ